MDNFLLGYINVSVSLNLRDIDYRTIHTLFSRGTHYRRVYTKGQRGTGCGQWPVWPAAPGP